MLTSRHIKLLMHVNEVMYPIKVAACGSVANTAMGKLDRPAEALLEHSEVLSEAASG